MDRGKSMSGKAATSKELFTKYIRNKRNINAVTNSLDRLRKA